MKIFYILFLPVFFTSCYTAEQSVNQLKLLMSQKPLMQAMQDNKDKLDRYEKLNLVQPVLQYAEKEVHLTPKNSYQKFIELKSPFVSWVVQAANKRSLQLKTWWFPFVGEQPYLGFFYKEDAIKEMQKLKTENYDVSMGGVKAFSLLGYYPDPLYSSMLDGVSLPDFIETLIHETVHKTIYIKGNYSFNENLANFIARKATILFLQQHFELGINTEDYIKNYQKKQIVQQKFNQFLTMTKNDLNNFYTNLNKNPDLKEAEFLNLRRKKFDEIADNYIAFMAGSAKNTGYEFAFQKGKFNNATILSYAIYEEEQKPLEDIFLKSNKNLAKMVDNLKMTFGK